MMVTGLLLFLEQLGQAAAQQSVRLVLQAVDLHAPVQDHLRVLEIAEARNRFQDRLAAADQHAGQLAGLAGGV
jgi:hypothetical protein